MTTLAPAWALSPVVLMVAADRGSALAGLSYASARHGQRGGRGMADALWARPGRPQAPSADAAPVSAVEGPIPCATRAMWVTATVAEARSVSREPFRRPDPQDLVAEVRRGQFAPLPVDRLHSSDRLLRDGGQPGQHLTHVVPEFVVGRVAKGRRRRSERARPQHNGQLLLRRDSELPCDGGVPHQSRDLGRVRVSVRAWRSRTFRAPHGSGGRARRVRPARDQRCHRLDHGQTPGRC